MDKYVIIVAGGKGLRMGGEVPKQFMLIGGKPVLARTIELFYQYDPAVRIILVLPQEQMDYWKKICLEYDIPKVSALVSGGETRFHSVQNGLSAITCSDEALVAVHDGVRPFVSVAVVADCFKQAELSGAAIPVVSSVESIRYVDSQTGISHAENRDAYKLVQTPQTFRLSLLRKAYAQDFQSTFTDDASVVEALGENISLVSGNRENIKLTTPFDIRVAQVLLDL